MKRTLPGILLALFWLLLLLKGSALVFYLVMIVVASIGANEYLNMVFPGNNKFLSRCYLMAVLILPVILSGFGMPGTYTLPALFLSFFLLTLYFIVRYTHFEDSYDRLSRLFFGVMYVGVLASYLVVLRFLPEGGAWLVVLSAITAGSDSGAYYFGSNFGKRQLCPGISPKKTVEGALGGLLCGVSAALLSALLLFDSVNMLFLFCAATILTGVGILGDLTESIIKRGTGTKDSGTLLAGHGGVLDRIDSLLLTAPVLYYMLLFMGVE